MSIADHPGGPITASNFQSAFLFGLSRPIPSRRYGSFRVMDFFHDIAGVSAGGGGSTFRLLIPSLFFSEFGSYEPSPQP